MDFLSTINQDRVTFQFFHCKHFFKIHPKYSTISLMPLIIRGAARMSVQGEHYRGSAYKVQEEPPLRTSENFRKSGNFFKNLEKLHYFGLFKIKNSVNFSALLTKNTQGCANFEKILKFLMKIQQKMEFLTIVGKVFVKTSLF